MDNLYMSDEGRVVLITHAEDEWYEEDTMEIPYVSDSYRADAAEWDKYHNWGDRY